MTTMITKTKVGRTRAPNGKGADQRVSIGLNLGAAQKLRALQDQFHKKLGFELTASQLIEYLHLLHTKATYGETLKYVKSSHMVSCPSYTSGEEDDCVCTPS